MLNRSLAVILFTSIAACGSPGDVTVDGITAPVVYGNDDRFDVFEHPIAELRRIARESIVTIIPTQAMVRNQDGTWSVNPTSLGELFQLCPDERFANHPAPGSCSGTLIQDDLVLTAGHCFDDSSPCNGNYFVFDFHLEGPNELAAITDEDVYTCNELLVDTGPPEGEYPFPDFAVLRLDRPPVQAGRRPAVLRPPAPFQPNDPIAIIGAPSGIPVKIDSGGQVLDPRNQERDYIVTNLDAFQGNSGSSTYDVSFRVAGILVNGRGPDYADSGEGCQRVTRFNPSEGGENVQSIIPVVNLLCENGVGVDGVCNQGGSSGGCSAVSGSTNRASLWAGLLLLLVTWRLRRTRA